MGTFVTNPSEMIPGPKNANRTVPEGGDPNDYFVAADYNAIRGAAHDLRDAVLNANLSVTATGSTTGRTLPARFADTFNVKDFGAVGDGSTDDTSAIQAALDAARTAGGGVVLVPRGTFIVAPPGATSPITIGSNVTLAGTGPGSVLKVKDGAGSYTTVFGGYTGTVTNVRVRDLRVNQNSANKGGNIRAGVVGEGALIFYFTDFNDVAIERVVFDDVCGVNTVSLNGPTSKNGWVRDCRFRFVMGPTVPPSTPYDNTAVYLDCTGMGATGNRFESTIAARAEGAIELHGSQGVAANNTTIGYSSCVRAVTPWSGTDVPSNGFTITGNTCVDAGDAINLWCLTGYTLRDVTITGNTISLANAQRTTAYNLQAPTGIALIWDDSSPYDMDGAVDGLVISDNVIRFEKQNGVPADAASGGILLQQRGSIRNASVRGNVVINCPSTAIKLSVTKTGEKASRVTIDGNQIVDAGNDTSGGGYRSAMSIFGVLEDVHVTRNRVVDTNATFGGNYGLHVDAGTGSLRVVLDANSYTKADTGSGDFAFSIAGPGLNGQPFAGGVYKSIALAYSANIDMPAIATADEYTVTPTNGTAFVLVAPLGGTVGARFRVKIINTTGGALGTLSWGGSFKTGTWTQPATGTHRTADFVFNGTNWLEVSRSPVDIPN